MAKIRITSIGIMAIAVGAILSLPASADETITYTYDSLGRLVAVGSTGTVNSGEAHSLCYDVMGNRERYLSTSDNTLANCPVPPAPNSPPNITAVTQNILCGSTQTFNVLGNATDPEGNTPLVFTGIFSVDGDSAATVASSSSIVVVGAATQGTTDITYTIEDSLGDASNGVLTINTVGPPNQCDAGGGTGS